MQMIRRIILLSPILFFICLLSACSSTSAVKGPEFDANVDIYAIEDAVRVFQKLPDSAKSDSSIENIFLVADQNTSALDGIEEATNKFLANLDKNWDSIRSGDSPNGISKNVLKEWGEAYLFWIEYQRKMQAIAEVCLANPESFKECQLDNAIEIVSLDSESQEPMKRVHLKIQAWKDKYANN